ncbi:MAG: FadR family transcriptional regulator [Anaerolineales bacterium]|nr:FadR family transcriptional regulator [Anaerolineales bacterium]
MLIDRLDSRFLQYLVAHNGRANHKLPSLNDISDELGISVGKLREQLEVARQMGLVSVRPRVGIQREPFDFQQVIEQGTLFGLATGEASFAQLNQLRRAVEIGFWSQAVVLLTAEDKESLRQIVASAWQKLRGEPIHVPNEEHRQLHLTIFSRLDNPFAQGILATYWEAYRASELTRYTRYQYWVDVWTYHENIVETLVADEPDRGLQLLIEHFALIRTSPPTSAPLSVVIGD